jgi:hypothetical protein
MREQRHRNHAVVTHERGDLHHACHAEEVERALIRRVTHFMSFEKLGAIVVERRFIRLIELRTRAFCHRVDNGPAHAAL